MTDLTLRTSARHWGELTCLLAAFERCTEACSRLDAYRALVKNSHFERREFEGRLKRLTALVDREVDRVTAERLMVDLRLKMKATAA